MSNGGFITIVGTEEGVASTRGGRGQVERVASQIRVEELQRKFSQFMESLQGAFAVESVRTQAGTFELSQIQFSAELSASGDFKLLGTGVGVSAGSTLTFVLTRREVG